MKNLSILGSTGSIGESSLSVVSEYPERFRVVALAAGENLDKVRWQIHRFRPQLVALHREEAARQLARELTGVRVVGGQAGVIEAATYPAADCVIAAISGAAGLQPTYHAIREGKQVALANKETLVMAGGLIMNLLAEQGVPDRLMPVDSEHSALHQCLRGEVLASVRRLVLTASGGPFLNRPATQLANVTREEALRHPTWQMGPKITIDSATLMNKGLEVIEAHYLFGLPAEQIDIVIHPQSTVHSLVEFIDGNYQAQLSQTDMRSAILYALTYPDRIPSPFPRLDLLQISKLEFEAPDPERFPCIRLAYAALRAGGAHLIALNAANEVAVARFLQGRISFPSIPELIERVMNEVDPTPISTLEEVLEVDESCRERARRALAAESS